MKRLTITFVLVFAALFVSNISKGATPQYSLTDLGSGCAYSVNNNGQVVGSNSIGIGPYSFALLFDTTGEGNNTLLGFGTAYSINDSGHIVGRRSFTAVDYVLDPDFGYSDVPMVGRAAYSINNNEQTVGYGRTSSYDEALIFTGIPYHYEATSLGYGQARSNNDSNQIVGRRGSDNKAVVWNPDGSGGYISTGLGTLSGYEESWAFSINNSGKIVGSVVHHGPEFQIDTRAVLFDETGGGQNICLDNAGSFANGINDNGQIVGASSEPGPGYVSFKATLFDPTGGGNNIDLNTTLINPLSDWTLTQAYSINKDGWIVGYMTHSTLGEHAFLLVPVPKHSPVACIADVNQPIEGQGPFGAKVVLDGSCSSDADSTPGTNDDINDFDWYRLDPADSNNEILLGSGQILDCNLALGSHTILLEVIDKAGESDSNEITVTIEDTTPPQFNFSVSPNVLWPPNGKMVKITPTYDVNDICDESPEVSILGVTASEPGDANDIKITDDGSIYLCARRSGNSTGLIYTITCQACDASGNCTIKSATVTVPHDCR